MGGSVDQKKTVYSLMKELHNQNRFIHKKDLLTVVRRNGMQESDLERVLNELCEDGVIHSAYDNDIYSITTDWRVLVLSVYAV